MTIGLNVITNSRLSCLKQCARKHKYRYEDGIRPDRSAAPLRFGGAYHVGLDARKKGMSATEAVFVAQQSYEVLPTWCITDEQVFDWQVERETVGRLLAGYFTYWESAAVPPELRPREIVASEIAFDLPIVNPETGRATPKYRLGGKIDAIVRLADGRLAIMEHKTTSDALDADGVYWKRLRLDHQISTYMHAARRLGYDVQTVLYDVCRKPGIRPKTITKAEAAALGDASLAGTKESPCLYGVRLSNDIAERPEFYYARREIPRLDADLAEFEQELWDQTQMLNDSKMKNRWPRNTNACVGFGQCEYLDHCLAGFESGIPSGFIRVADLHPELQGE